MQADPISTPEKWISLSSPIMISSISLQLPSFVFSGFSKVEAISPPAGQTLHLSSRDSLANLCLPGSTAHGSHLTCRETEAKV